MGTTPGFVCIYFRAQLWDRTDKVFVSSWGPKNCPLSTTRNPGDPHCEDTNGFLVEGASRGRCCAACSPGAAFRTESKVVHGSGIDLRFTWRRRRLKMKMPCLKVTQVVRVKGMS